MVVLCDVQHRRLCFRSVTRLSLVCSWSPSACCRDLPSGNLNYNSGVVRTAGGRWNCQTSALVPCFLTLDALTRPRNRLQPLRFYVTAAFGALAETPLAYTF